MNLFFNVPRGVYDISQISGLTTGSSSTTAVGGVTGIYVGNTYLTGQVNLVGTGNVYLSSNNNNIYISGSGSSIDTSNFATAENLTLTGQSLYNSIIAFSGVPDGVTRLIINGTAISGWVTLIGTGDVALSTNSNNVYISGSGTNPNTGIYATIDNLNATGQALYSYISNVSGSGLNGVNQINVTGAPLTGQISFYPTGNFAFIVNDNGIYFSGYDAGTISGEWASSANLTETGQTLYGYLLGMSGNYGVSEIDVDGTSSTGKINLIGTGNVFITSNNSNIYISGSGNTVDTSSFATSTNLTLTGQSLYNSIIAFSGVPDGVTKLILDGVGISGDITTLASGNITLTKISNSICISGANADTGTYATVSNLNSSGQRLFNLVTGLSGIVPFSPVTGISVTGSNSLINRISITGAGSTSTILNGQNIIISGQPLTTTVFSGGCLLALCTAYTPDATGADMAEIPVPCDPRDGSGIVTYNVRRTTLRVATAGGAPSCELQKTTGAGAFDVGASLITSLIMATGDNEIYKVTGLGTVQSRDKLRFNVTNLGSAQYWTLVVELGT